MKSRRRLVLTVAVVALLAALGATWWTSVGASELPGSPATRADAAVSGLDGPLEDLDRALVPRPVEEEPPALERRAQGPVLIQYAAMDLDVLVLDAATGLPVAQARLQIDVEEGARVHRSDESGRIAIACTHAAPGAVASTPGQGGVLADNWSEGVPRCGFFDGAAVSIEADGFSPAVLTLDVSRGTPLESPRAIRLKQAGILEVIAVDEAAMGLEGVRVRVSFSGRDSLQDPGTQPTKMALGR